MPSFLERAIDERNIRKIRSALGTEIMTDPTGKKGDITKAIEKIKKSGLNIWEEHDGRSFETSPVNWNKDYFTKLQAQLSSNFSKERFEHILKVGKKVYASELKNRDIDKRNKNEAGVTVNTQCSNDSMGKGLLLGLVVVVTISAIVAIYYATMKD